jgi:hypothetical protein
LGIAGIQPKSFFRILVLRHWRLQPLPDVSVKSIAFSLKEQT